MSGLSGVAGVAGGSGWSGLAGRARRARRLGDLLAHPEHTVGYGSWDTIDQSTVFGIQ